MKKKCDLIDELSKIVDFIQNDIDYQTEKLSGDFEEDKSLSWRIVGLNRVMHNILIRMGELQDGDPPKEENQKVNK